MKVFKIIIISLLVLIVLLFIGIFVFIKTFDANKYLPQMTSQISQVIGRDVRIKSVHLDFNLLKGFSLNLKELVVSDDIRFSRNNFLSIGKTFLRIDTLALLLERKLIINSVVISSPKISIVRSSDGTINATTIGAEKTSEKSSKSVESKQSSLTNSSSSAVVLPEILIKSILIEHAELSFEDRNFQLPLSVHLNNIEAKINGFSLTKTFDFIVYVNAWSKIPNNIDISGRCSLDLPKNSVSLSDLKILTNLNQWDWTRVKSISSVLEKISIWPQDIKGIVLIKIPQLNASAKGLEKVALTVSLKEGYIKFNELLGPITNININIESDLNELVLKEFKGGIGLGEFNSKGNIHNLLVNPQYDFQIVLKGINIEELLNESLWPVELKGYLNGNLSLKSESFDSEAILKNLKGEGDLYLTDAKIDKLNIFNLISDKLSFIPGLVQKLDSKLSPRIKEKLNRDTTLLDKVQSTFRLQDKVLSITDAKVESNIFSIKAQGTLTFNLIADIDVNTYLPPDLSDELVGTVESLNGLLDNEKRLYIPGKVSGQGTSIKYMPNVDDITKKALLIEGVNQLEKVLDKNPKIKNILNSILGGSQEPSSGDELTSTDNQTKPKEDSSKKLISDVLNKILR